MRPARWIIVDDGSSDQTPDSAAAAAKQYDWIRLHRRRDRGARKVGGGVVEAFNEGLSLIDLDDYDYLCKLDGDLEFGPTYFERLFEKFESHPRLGTASGKTWIHVQGRRVSERIGDGFSQGAAKLYRTRCFREIGGFVRGQMWDGIDCHRCRMLGWEARSFRDEELRLLHLRQMGSSYRNIFHGRLRWGRGQYFMGTHWLYALAIAAYRMFERPFVIGGLWILLGYWLAGLRRIERYNDPDFRRFLRRWQLARLRPF